MWKNAKIALKQPCGRFLSTWTNSFVDCKVTAEKVQVQKSPEI